MQQIRADNASIASVDSVSDTSIARSPNTSSTTIASATARLAGDELVEVPRTGIVVTLSNLLLPPRGLARRG